MLTENQTIKVMDFGLAALFDEVRTAQTQVSGTPLYMSPEQIRGQSLDARSDIFSFGITMYELFTGRHPCSGTDSRMITRQLLSPSYKFEPPSKYNPEIPPALDRIILKALRRNPDQRYQSMTEMLLDLQRVAQSRI